jgi:hypothetical protein
MRNFDLQLAIATLRLPALSFMSRLERIRTIPVVYGGNRADPFFEKRSAAAPPDTPMRWRRSAGT